MLNNKCVDLASFMCVVVKYECHLNILFVSYSNKNVRVLFFFYLIYFISFRIYTNESTYLNEKKIYLLVTSTCFIINFYYVQTFFVVVFLCSWAHIFSLSLSYLCRVVLFFVVVVVDICILFESKVWFMSPVVQVAVRLLKPFTTVTLKSISHVCMCVRVRVCPHFCVFWFQLVVLIAVVAINSLRNWKKKNRQPQQQQQ